MFSLIGKRFLKQFMGSCLHRRRVNPDYEGMTLPADVTGKPVEPGYTTRGNPLDKDATLEIKPTGEIHQLAIPENGSDQPTTDDFRSPQTFGGQNGRERRKIAAEGKGD